MYILTQVSDQTGYLFRLLARVISLKIIWVDNDMPSLHANLIKLLIVMVNYDLAWILSHFLIVLPLNSSFFYVQDTVCTLEDGKPIRLLNEFGCFINR